VYEFKLPDLGEGIHEGEILKWHVQPGTRIGEDEPLVDVETDKAAVTIPSPRGGQIVSLGGQVGDIIRVGDVITVIDANGESAAPDTSSPASADAQTSAPSTAPAPPTPRAAAPEASPARPSAPPRADGGRAIATPATRRLARELRIDINQVPPTGPGGRVTVEDLRGFVPSGAAPTADEHALAVPAAPEAADAAPRRPAAVFGPGTSPIPFLDLDPMPDFEQWGPVVREPLRSIRRRVARKMTTSMILVPHVAHMDEADVTELEAIRQRERERRGDQPGGRLTLLSFVVKAVTAGLKAAAAFNASIDPFNEELIYKKYFNIGIAVDTGRGLVVPVIRNTDRKSIAEVSAEIEALAARAREGQLEPADMHGGTFTITNVGPLGGTALIPTINYPEVAILGMGRAQKKPVVRNGQIVIRNILPLTLAFDHRVADGADAARFVSEMARQLADPNALLLEV
jgi:pyruvate dehydrogenase E2 component (dihydrolipoamide acetyltransferase)